MSKVMGGQKDIAALFGLLEGKKLTPQTAKDRLGAMGGPQLIDLAKQLEEMVPHARAQAASPFDFVAGRRLSGGPDPCTYASCRVKRVDATARFAALYADRTLIEDPFEALAREEIANGRPLLLTREDFLASVLVLHRVRPLLESGIMGFSASSIPFCQHCDPWAKDACEELKQALDRAREALVAKYGDRVRVTVDELAGATAIKFSGPRYLIEHSPLILVLRGASSKKGKSEHLPYLFAPILHDVWVQSWYSLLYSSSILASHDISLEVFRAVNSEETNVWSNALLEGFSHSLPYVDGVGLEDLLKLRCEEGESFQVYRDAACEALRSVRGANAKVVREAFNDLVQPEVRKIELTLHNSRRTLLRSLARDTSIGAAFVGVGLFSGLLPSDVGQVLAVLGGYKFISGLLEKADSIAALPRVVRDNEYFFLWKAGKLRSKKGVQKRR